MALIMKDAMEVKRTGRKRSTHKNVHRRETERLRFKASARLVDMRHKERSMVRQKDYRAAQALREEADMLEAQEMDAALERQQERWALEDQRLLEKHGKELEALDERIGRMFNELKQRREQALLQLLHRYEVSKTALVRQQKLEARDLSNAMRQGPVAKAFRSVPLCRCRLQHLAPSSPLLPSLIRLRNVPPCLSQSRQSPGPPRDRGVQLRHAPAHAPHLRLGLHCHPHHRRPHRPGSVLRVS